MKSDNTTSSLKVVLRHPGKRKGISIDKVKYELLKSELVKFLTSNREATFSAMVRAVAESLKRSGTTFHGSLPWYLEWVKLDLEARTTLQRVARTSPQLYTLSKKRKPRKASP